MLALFRMFSTSESVASVWTDSTRLLAISGTPILVCLLWLSRRLNRQLRLAAAIVVLLVSAAGLTLAGLSGIERANLLLVVCCAFVCLSRDWYFRHTGTGENTVIEVPPLNPQDAMTAEWFADRANGDDVTNVVDNGMVLNLEDLAPEIDAVSASEFALRAARVGVFSDEQIAALEKLIDDYDQLSSALKEAIARETLTVYQALHLLWGKEDRLRIGPYALRNVLGVGGMSVVYRAQKLSGENEIALKVVPKATRHESRFRREMQLAQLLAHPNIVVAYEVGETVDRYYIAMELVTGRNLQDVVRLHGSLSEAVALQYLLQAARGLEHAHERGVIHRDVKPGNLLLCEDGTVKVADLGLSQETGDMDTDGRVTEAVSGTLDFMAPEQADPVARSVPQLDVYGLGTTLFFLLTGQPMIAGRTTSEKLLNLTVGRRFNRLPPQLAGSKTKALLKKMTAWEPSQRHSSITEVIEDIERILEKMGRDYTARSVHVLVVEDDPAQMFLTVRLLSRTNRSIRVSKSDRLATGLETFDEFSETDEPVDLVLLDLHLPDSSGIESIVRLRSAHPDAAVIVLSGQSAESIEADCLAAGASGFLSKADLSLSALERTLFTLQSQFRSQSMLQRDSDAD